jgi:hypothetical protein
MAPALPGWSKVKFVVLCFRGWEVPSETHINEY